MADVLIVDDDPDCGDLLARLLARRGHEVRVANDAKDALRELAREVPDAMLLDLTMPDMDGSQLLLVIRSCLLWRALPVVAWTALDVDDPLVQQVRQLGISQVVFKARSSLVQILAAIERALPPQPPPSDAHTQPTLS